MDVMVVLAINQAKWVLIPARTEQGLYSGMEGKDRAKRTFSVEEAQLKALAQPC